VSSPVIAILGRLNEKQGDEQLVETNTAAVAATAIGTALAKAGCRIKVYDSSPEYAATKVVEGYHASRHAKPKSIIVCRPAAVQPPLFAGEKERRELFSFEAADSKIWEVSFLLSFPDVDGVIAMGNGYFTQLGGLQALAMKIPVVALAGYGGVAADLWRKNKELAGNFATAEEHGLVAERNTSAKWAEDCVAVLLTQRHRRAEAAEADTAIRWWRRLMIYVLVAVSIFLGGLAAIGRSWQNSSLSAVWAYTLTIGPAFLGIVGAAVRSVLDVWLNRKPISNIRSILAPVALGFVAGGLAALLFLIEQRAALEGLTDQKIGIVLPSALIVGFTAGLTLDRVLLKLLKLDAMDPDTILGKNTRKRMKSAKDA